MYKGVSLFANVGIAETYLHDSNVDIVVANELLDERAKFYREMYPSSNMITGDITNPEVYNKVLENAKKENCDFLIATPPCQGFSMAGKMEEDDIRNSLIKYVIKMIQDLKPKNILIENVPGMLKSYILHNGEKIKMLDYIEQELDGYIINTKVVNTADYGTPQNRKRAIFLISNIKKWEFPDKEKIITVKEAISHLPTLEAGETSEIPYHNAKKHNDNHILWMKHTPTNKSAFENEIHFPKKDGRRIKGFMSTYKRLDWDKPAHTITMANGSVSSQNNVHPGRSLGNGLYSDARVLTLKEIFILTGLPENWTPPTWAKENLIRQVIGEGVPPKLIERLLKNIPIVKCV